MAKITDRDTKKLVRTFIHSCLDKGLTTNKGFELLNELMTMIEEKRCDEKIWLETIDRAVAEANKEGVIL
ncbi:Uncharacterized protein BC067498_05520 [Bacillus cereus]|nr:Uncharacterized protein BC067498_05520 [Bacillus cereus]